MADIGEVLYDFYRQAAAERGCLMDAWNTLSKEDQQDWRTAADNLCEWARS